MPDNLKKELQDSIQALYVEGDIRRFSSKTIIVREIYDDIEKARLRGVTLSMFLRVLQDKGFDISYPEFKQILYRIRKERKSEVENKSENNKQSTPQKSLIDNVPPQKEIATPTVPLTQTQQLDYQAKIKAFNEVECDDWKGKYIALGGNPDELKDLSPAGQRNKVVKLRMKLSSENL